MKRMFEEGRDSFREVSLLTNMATTKTLHQTLNPMSDIEQL